MGLWCSYCVVWGCGVHMVLHGALVFIWCMGLWCLYGVLWGCGVHMVLYGAVVFIWCCMGLWCLYGVVWGSGVNMVLYGAVVFIWCCRGCHFGDQNSWCDLLPAGTSTKHASLILHPMYLLRQITQETTFQGRYVYRRFIDSPKL